MTCLQYNLGEKKVASLQKKLNQIKAKGKSGKEVVDVEKQLAKAEADLTAVMDPFPYKTSVPLTRMQTEAEFAQKSARAKALEIALQKTAAEADGAEDVVGDELPVYGFQAAKHDKAAAAGVEIQSKKSKKTDKSLRDIFKLGSHILK